ncbi:hypothetical protein [Vibrio parahaemolyticus]|uniref:hypothetical protein n=1 Tax=Vibrio parahaemolyticus TaxID=670 RepID=UPI00235F9742|nr:hypothetical protein [Vibrio parahaemolyticus]
MREFLRDKDLIKDAFQALAYFVFLAGALKLALPEIQTGSVIYKVGVALILTLLSFLAVCYAMLHVSSEITKKYYPDFDPPILGNKKVPFKEVVSSRCYWLWFAIGIPYYLVGIEIVKMGFN